MSNNAIAVVEIGSNRDALIEPLAELWERSVRATHDFLEEEDIVGMRPEVRNALAFVEHLAVAHAQDDAAYERPLGFAGAQDDMLEMLFCDADARGKGVGSTLLLHAIRAWNVTRLDVNEQNPSAAQFYRDLGFVCESRSELDSEGRPFPILHMTLAQTASV